MRVLTEPRSTQEVLVPRAREALLLQEQVAGQVVSAPAPGEAGDREEDWVEHGKAAIASYS